MRILYHHRTQAEDGQAVHVRALIGAFRDQGHEVREVGLVRHGEEGASEAAVGRARWGWITRTPRFVRELAEYGYNGVARRNILRAAVRFEPELLYERHAFGNVAGVLAARRLRIPHVVEVNSPMTDELEATRGLSFPGLGRKLERFVFTEASLLCAVSGVLRKMLVEAGAPADRVLVTPNGVDLAAYDYPDRPLARRLARADLGLLPEAPGEVVLGFVGYYRRWHRLDAVVRALARPELKQASLVLVGDGPAREELEREAADLGVAGRVHFAGTRPHARIPSLLPAFDVALIPAINPYASPLKLHEYMAASLAVVAPDQENLREVLTAEEDALLVPSADSDALFAALTELAGDPERRAALGARARRKVEELDLTWAGNVRRVLGAVEELRSRRRAS